MIFVKIKSDVVAHLSYFIGAKHEAIVVDPQRDADEYLRLSKRYGVRVKYIFETHRNEDYVVGSKELAQITGAEIYHGPWPDFQYGNKVEDGQQFKVGSLRVTAIHTPGHTPGDVSYAVTDLNSGEEPVLVCTGDTLFVNDVGRTDFGGPSKRREWSTNLYNSIHGKLLPLGDHVVICPAHGSGSVCGGGIADREISTLGTERLMNPLLQLSKEEFIEYKVNERHHYAPYFEMMEKYNVEGAPFVGLGAAPPALSPLELKALVDDGAVVIDTRPPPAFGAGHIKGSYSLPRARLGMGGWVLPYDKPLALVISDQNHLDPMSRGLTRMGYDNQAGYLTGTIVTWYKQALPIETLDTMTVHELNESLEAGDWLVLDVRSADEYEQGHIEGSLNSYAGMLPEHFDDVPRDRPVAVICASGTRSSFASSILLRGGFSDIHNVLGGMTAWKNGGYKVIK